MAQYKGTLQGISRLGHKTTGMTATVAGWHDGVMVTADYEDGKDVFKIWSVAGSGLQGQVLLGTLIDGKFTANKGGKS